LKVNISKIVSFVFAIAFLSIASYAAPRPDLAVQTWVAPSSVFVNSPYQYTARVRNIGNQSASGVVLSIEFPLTNTSPTKRILGKVTGFPSNCSISNNRLVCNLGSISSNPNNNLRTVSFNFEYPVTTKPLNLIARASTTSMNEIVTANNELPYAPAVTYQDLPITTANVVVSHCTGQNLTSYFECELYPSSISSFEMTLDTGGVITLAYPGYFGNWDQPTAKQLHFVVTDGSSGAEFNGFTSKTNCFDGIANFTPSSPYMSPYRVCIQ